MAVILLDDIATPNHARIGYDDVVESLSATSAKPERPAMAAGWWTTFEYWQPTSYPATLTATFAEQPVDYIAILHRLSNDAVVEYEEGGAWKTIDYDIFPDWQPTMVLFSTKQLTGVRVTANTAGDLVIKLAVGQALVMPHAIFGGHSPGILSRDAEITHNISESGELLGVYRKWTGKSTSFAWERMTADWYRTYFDPFVAHCETKPFFVAWNPLRATGDVLYCASTGDIQPSNSGKKDWMEFDLPVKAYSAGGDIYSLDANVVWGDMVTPTITSPTEGSTTSTTPTIKSSDYVFLGAAHLASQWRIVSAGTTIHDSGEDQGSLTSYTVPDGVLDLGAEYTVEVRHKGASVGWSNWSEPVGLNVYEAVPMCIGDVVAGTPALPNLGDGIYADDTYVYAGSFGEPYFTVVRKSDWSIVEGTPALPGAGRGVYVDDTYVYLAHSIDPYFTVIRKSDWSIVEGTPAPPNRCQDVHADDTYVYLVHLDFPYFTVIRKSDWSIVEGTPALPSHGEGVRADDTYVYLAHIESPHFTAVRKSDWSIVEGTPALPGNGYSVYDDDLFVYLGRTGGFTVVRKSDWSIVEGTPAEPSNTCHGIYADDTYVYLAYWGDPHFTAVRKSDWSIVEGTPALPGNGFGVYADDTYIYLTHDGSPYFTVIELTPC